MVVVAEHLSALVTVEDLEEQEGGAELRSRPERRLDVQAEPQLDRELVLEGEALLAAGCLRPCDPAQGTVQLGHTRTVPNGLEAPRMSGDCGAGGAGARPDRARPRLRAMVAPEHLHGLLVVRVLGPDHAPDRKASPNPRFSGQRTMVVRSSPMVTRPS